MTTNPEVEYLLDLVDGLRVAVETSTSLLEDLRCERVGLFEVANAARHLVEAVGEGSGINPDVALAALTEALERLHGLGTSWEPLD